MDIIQHLVYTVITVKREHKRQLREVTTMNKGYYNENTLRKFAEGFKAACAKVDAGEDLRVRISDRNSKMGAIASVSLLPFLTCPDACKGTCGAKCYAAKLANMRPSLLNAYAINTAIALHRPESYWAQVDAACKGVRFFRFHVSGDIINAEYFSHMVQVAENNPHCEILAFTKRYDAVNAWISENGQLPANLHVLFSGWTNLEPVNPHRLPETNVIPRGETAAEGWKMCGGNCFDCAISGAGCWSAGRGDVIAFNMH